MDRGCVVCGAPCGTHGGRLTCSQLCRNALAGARNAVRSRLEKPTAISGICVCCGGPTKIAVSSHRPFKYCSNECRHEHQRQTRGTKIVSRKCEQCGAMFETAENNNQRYCSKDCRKESERARRRILNGTTHVRRCKKHGCYFEHVDPKEIFRRDKWICQVCMAPVNPAAKWPEDDCATLDHIIPLSKGGAHSPDNLQCAHAACNIRKSCKLEALYG